MKTAFLTLLFLGFYHGVFAQTILVGKNKERTKNGVESDFRKIKYVIAETDTTLTLTTNDTTIRPIIVYCGFKKDGQCFSQKIVFDCDTCYHKILKQILNRNRFEWKKVGADQYLSKYSSRLLLAGSTDNKNYTISLLDVTDEEYKKLMNTPN